MLKKMLYQKYHSKIRLQKRIIDKNNFTYRNIIGTVDPYLFNGNTVLDIGSATGTLSFYFASKGLEVDGIELSKNAYKYAIINKKKFRINNINFINISIEKYKTSKKYNLVTCFEVLEHLYNDYKILTKINAMMKKQSFLIISVPSKNAPLYRLGVLNNFDRRVGHLRRYTLLDIKKTVKSAGFKVVRSFKKEGLLRNILFTIPFFGWIVRFTRFSFINNLITNIDDFTLRLFGESQIILVCKKK